MTAYAAVVLAAGQASRYRAAGGRELTKVLAMLRGETLVRHVTRAALASRAAPVILVTGHAAEAVTQAVGDLPLMRVHNADYADGMATSLRCGLLAVPATCDGALVLLADMPGVGSAALNTLMFYADTHSDADAVVPVVSGRRGNPVLLKRGLFAAATTLSGDSGARQLLRHPALRVHELALDHNGLLDDIDLPDELHAISNTG